MKIYIVEDVDAGGEIQDLCDLRFFTSMEGALEMAEVVMSQVRRGEIPWVVGINIWETEADVWNEEPELVWGWARE